MIITLKITWLEFRNHPYYINWSIRFSRNVSAREENSSAFSTDEKSACVRDTIIAFAFETFSYK